MSIFRLLTVYSSTGYCEISTPPTRRSKQDHSKFLHSFIVERRFQIDDDEDMHNHLSIDHLVHTMPCVRPTVRAPEVVSIS
jgi:hypothetical protein